LFPEKEIGLPPATFCFLLLLQLTLPSGNKPIVLAKNLVSSIFGQNRFADSSQNAPLKKFAGEEATKLVAHQSCGVNLKHPESLDGKKFKILVLNNNQFEGDYNASLVKEGQDQVIDFSCIAKNTPEKYKLDNFNKGMAVLDTLDGFNITGLQDSNKIVKSQLSRDDLLALTGWQIAVDPDIQKITRYQYNDSNNDYDIVYFQNQEYMFEVTASKPPSTRLSLSDIQIQFADNLPVNTTAEMDDAFCIQRLDIIASNNLQKIQNQDDKSVWYNYTNMPFIERKNDVPDFTDPGYQDASVSCLKPGFTIEQGLTVFKDPWVATQYTVGEGMVLYIQYLVQNL
jgi:hypothetical protein